MYKSTNFLKIKIIKPA